jgi:regulator of sigma E protease
LGVVVSDVEMKKFPFWQMPWRGTVEGFKEAFGWTALILSALKKMVVDLIIHGTIPKDVAGPVGIFQITGMVAKSGLLNILQFIGILSVNLAVINILPFPALDGGRLIFVVYEAITRRRPKPSFERWVNTAGMAFLLMLIILITINDVIRLIKK